MPGRWSDEGEWYERERGDRYGDRYDVFRMRDGREADRDREARSFGRGDRAFGGRDRDLSYSRPQAGADWQDREYGGVSPAMRRGDYESGYRPHPRFQGDDDIRGDGRRYGEDYGYGASPRRYDSEGRRFGSYEADQRWAREMRRPMSSGSYSGGTGGYDYERGYGDGGRYEGRDRDDDGFEEWAREAGDFFRRTGRRISNWFSDVAGDGGYGEDRQRYEAFRGARGRGPKGYQRSDERISDEVNQRLTDDPWLDASEINVAVASGEVTLSGTVDGREAKHRAERIVEDLSGVKHVQNNLRIQAGGHGASTGGYAATGYGQGARDAAMGASDPVKDVTGGAATPPAQKRN